MQLVAEVDLSKYAIGMPLDIMYQTGVVRLALRPLGGNLDAATVAVPTDWIPKEPEPMLYLTLGCPDVVECGVRKPRRPPWAGRQPWWVR